MKPRSVISVVTATPSRDGAGVAIQRVARMGDPGLDPILMIDELRSDERADFIGGFPPHPHRGMQTLTYMKQGGIIHEDSRGNRGEIRSGGAQWMSAGGGIIHSEMPTRDTEGLHGFQIWINLPARRKREAPAYRDVPAAEFETAVFSGGALTAIAGDWIGQPDLRLEGPLSQLADLASIADLRLDAGSSIELETPEQDNLVVYVYDGALATERGTVNARQLAITDRGSRLRLAAAEAGLGALILRGAPLGEPVAHYGPFVMNTAAEIDEAIRDYQSGRFG